MKTIKIYIITLLLIFMGAMSSSAQTSASPYAFLSSDYSTLTFYHDTYKKSRKSQGFVFDLNTGEIAPGWYGYRTNITKVVFDMSFNLARPTSCYFWFAGMWYLNSIENIQYLNTSNVTTMEAMFTECSNLETLDVTHFDTSKVTNMCSMFSNCSALLSLDVTHFNTSNVTNMEGMFSVASLLTKLDVSQFNTSKVTTMAWMFYGCEKLTTLDLNNFDTSYVTDMQSMFYGCESLKTLKLNNFVTSNVTTMDNMFEGCIKLTTLDVSHFDTSKVTTMYCMFELCKSLKSLDVSHFNTSSVTNMGGMFSDCETLTYLDVSHFKTSNVTNFEYIFRNCFNLSSLDLSSFDFSNIDINFSGNPILGGNFALKKLTVPFSSNLLNDGAFTGVGSPESPCQLIYPDNMELEKYNVTDRYFGWKGGIFYDIIKGDVNQDGQITVADVMMVVGYLTGKHSSGFHQQAGDMNDDGDISIADVMEIVNIVVKGY